MIIICRETLSVKAAKGIVRETRPIIVKQIMQLAASAYSSSCHQNCGLSHHDSQMTARIMKNHARYFKNSSYFSGMFSLTMV